MSQLFEWLTFSFVYIIRLYYEKQQAFEAFISMYTMHKPDHSGSSCSTANRNVNLKIRKMKKNMGGADRIIRIIAAVAIGVLFYTGVLQGMLAYVLLGLAAIFVLTSFVSFCPLYTLVGLNTCKIK